MSCDCKVQTRKFGKLILQRIFEMYKQNFGMKIYNSKKKTKVYVVKIYLKG